MNNNHSNCRDLLRKTLECKVTPTETNQSIPITPLTEQMIVTTSENNAASSEVVPDLISYEINEAVFEHIMP